MFSGYFDSHSLATSRVGHPWDPKAQVIHFLHKNYTIPSLISKIGEWSLSETSIPNQHDYPSLMLLQDVLTIANKNMHTLKTTLTTCDYLSSDDRYIFGTMFNDGSRLFADLTMFLRQFEEEFPRWSSVKDLEDNISKRVGNDERVKGLVRRVYGFNNGIDCLWKFLKKRDENVENDEQEEEDKDGEEREEEEKAGPDEEQAGLGKGNADIDEEFKRFDLDEGKSHDIERLEKEEKEREQRETAGEEEEEYEEDEVEIIV